MVAAVLILAVTSDSADFTINWNEPDSIKQYVCEVYDKEIVPSDFIVEVIDRESSFIIVPSSCKNQVGLMQITPACAEAMGYDFQDVAKYPWLNIECGVKYLILCYEKAKGNLHEAYEYYNRGLWWYEVEAKKDSTGK